jgi:hypothetical protein
MADLAGSAQGGVSSESAGVKWLLEPYRSYLFEHRQPGGRRFDVFSENLPYVDH